MLRIRIQAPGGTANIKEFERTQVIIGRSSDCNLVLPAGSVSRRHAKLVVHEGRVVIADLGSANGTLVNGKRIAKPKVVHSGDIVTLGDYTLQVESKEQDEREITEATQRAVPEDLPLKKKPPAKKPSKPAAGPVKPVRPIKNTGRLSGRTRQKPAGDTAGSLSHGSDEAGSYSSLLRTVHEKLIDAMDLRRLDVTKLGDEALREKASRTVRSIVASMANKGAIPAGLSQKQLMRDVLNEALGLGPLEELLADSTVTEIMVNGADRIYVERDGKLEATDKKFSSNAAVYGIIERIVAPLGRRIDESSPLVDARLKDGSRVNAIIPPLSIKGPAITIRKFRKEMFSVDDMVRFGTLDDAMVKFLKVCVENRQDALISGGTGSGKTTTLNLLSSFIHESERIVTIEDAAELQLKQDHVVSLESRPPNIEGKGAIVIRDLVRNALRMRPDRIIVGECRGGEALDMLQAMNTGHDGSLTTAHANSPRDALSRLETMVLMSGMDLPVRAIREQIASAIDIIVHQSRMPDGSRKITNIVEVTGMEGDVITLQDIFLFEMTGYDDKGKVVGRFKPTGFIPKFYDELRKRKVPLDISIFRA
ncbi:MAG: Flp pilus assembly complex ATPase component [Deltaproteobacteria bacterium]|nr:Flp pilus assembly complex ATPase component [Deltaproteobacteria bacterium]